MRDYRQKYNIAATEWVISLRSTEIADADMRDSELKRCRCQQPFATRPSLFLLKSEKTVHMPSLLIQPTQLKDLCHG